MRLQRLISTRLASSGRDTTDMAEAARIVFCWHFCWHSRVEEIQLLAARAVRIGGGGRNRTDAYSFCRAVPYHLATPPIAARSINEFPGYARASCSSVLQLLQVRAGAAARLARQHRRHSIKI